METLRALTDLVGVRSLCVASYVGFTFCWAFRKWVVKGSYARYVINTVGSLLRYPSVLMPFAVLVRADSGEEVAGGFVWVGVWLFYQIFWDRDKDDDDDWFSRRKKMIKRWVGAHRPRVRASAPVRA